MTHASDSLSFFRGNPEKVLTIEELLHTPELEDEIDFQVGSLDETDTFEYRMFLNSLEEEEG